MAKRLLPAGSISLETYFELIPQFAKYYWNYHYSKELREMPRFPSVFFLPLCLTGQWERWKHSITGRDL